MTKKAAVKKAPAAKKAAVKKAPAAKPIQIWNCEGCGNPFPSTELNEDLVCETCRNPTPAAKPEILGTPVIVPVPVADPQVFCDRCGKSVSKKSCYSFTSAGAIGGIAYYCKSDCKSNGDKPKAADKPKLTAAEIAAKSKAVVQAAKEKTAAKKVEPKGKIQTNFQFFGKPVPAGEKMPRQMAIIINQGIKHASTPIPKYDFIAILEKETNTDSANDLKNRQPVLDIFMHYQRRLIDMGVLEITKPRVF